VTRCKYIHVRSATAFPGRQRSQIEIPAPSPCTGLLRIYVLFCGKYFPQVFQRYPADIPNVFTKPLIPLCTD
jgi:hypothetical protein